jgi:hypothetical protein
MNNVSNLILTLCKENVHAANYALALYQWYYIGLCHKPNPANYHLHIADAKRIFSLLDQAVALDNPVTLPDGF